MTVLLWFNIVDLFSPFYQSTMVPILVTGEPMNIASITGKVNTSLSATFNTEQ